MANNTFLGAFVRNYTLLISPLKDALTDAGRFRKLMLDLGWDIPAPPVAQAQQIVGAIEDMVSDIKNLPPSPSETDILNILVSIADIFDAIKSFANQVAGTTSGISPLQSVFIAEFPTDLFNYLIANYLNAKFGVAFNFLKLLGIVEYKCTAAVAPRPSYTRVRIKLDKLGQLVTNPLSLVKTSLNWNSAAFDVEQIFGMLSDYLASLGVAAVVRPKDDRYNVAVYNHAFGNTDLVTESLTIYLLDVLVGNTYQHLGVKMLGSLGATLADTGLILALDIPSGISLTQEISDDLTLKINLSSLIGESFAALIKPSGTQLKYLSSTVVPASSLELQLLYKPQQSALIFGKPEGTRLQVKDFSLSLGAAYAGALELTGEVDLSGISLIIDPGQSDSFISKVLGDQPREISFPITICWSSKNGISFKGSGSFEFNVNLHFKLGPIEFNDIKVALRAPQGQDKVKVEIGTNIKGDLGPIVFNVDNLGLGLTLGLHEGNAGPFDIKLGFKPPTGVGLAINAGPVKGGGFLNYDESTWTYTGGLELNFSKISFSAIGIVSTKLPGGEKGYSLLIIITAEFGPIPLGMGFTLNGLGGILGLHRTMNPDVLRTGIRDNTLDHILFPKDIVKNANTIISNINQAFPIKKGQFLVGPMAKIGWGTPTLLTIELGIIIELPEPVRLAILGVVKALLPSKENPIVKIQINFLGIIDFTNKYLSFDASLYDSQILTFGLFGDMALRLYWGDKPAFLLSVGGFHPRFTPPPLNLPELRRLTIVLANQDNLKISVETYFAVTSNSVQFGARVSAMAKAWKIQAIGALWFDILFQFKPFYFIADMGVMFAIKMGSKTILSLFVQLTLEGPNPWRAQGKGSFKILFVKVSVSFDKTFGQARVEAIEAVDVNPKLIAALTSDDNWEALLPERSHQMVAFREETTATLSVDPGGSLRISQRLLPLQTELQKFGSSAVKDSKRFDITGVTANGIVMDYVKVQDYFARNEFWYMKDEEKLSRPSYELFDSGVIAGSDNIASAYAVHKECDFEEITIDLGYRRPEPRFKLSAHMFGLQRFGNYISQSALSDFGSITTSKGPDRVRVSLEEDQFVLVDRNNLSTVAGLTFSNSADAERYLSDNMASAPAIAGEWIVANRFELATW